MRMVLPDAPRIQTILSFETDIECMNSKTLLVRVTHSTLNLPFEKRILSSPLCVPTQMVLLLEQFRKSTKLSVKPSTVVK
jgi:hypothetical protein